MTTLRQAAQQALEVCTDAVMGWQSLAPLSVRRAAMESLDALRDALAREDEMREMLRTLGFGSQCPESIGITLRRWRDGYAAALKVNQELLEALRDIGEYRGEGPSYTTPWQDIVRNLGEIARAAIAKAEGQK